MSRATDDRRKFPRRSLAITGSNPVLVTAGVLPRAALSRDISAVGMGILATFAPPVGSILPVWLPGRPGESSSLVLVRVIHVQATDSTLHHIGTVCHDEPSTAALHEFVNRLGEGT